MKTGRKQGTLILVLLVLLLVLSGCTDHSNEVSITPEPIVYVTPTPEPSLSESAAGVLSGIETSQLVVSIVFEGYANDQILEDVCKVLDTYDLDGLFFVDGNTAYEYPEMVSYLVSHDFEVGNSGMRGRVANERNSISANVHQFERTQQLIYSACGVYPKLACFSSSEYTTAVLQAVTASGLTGTVKPDIHINRDSFVEKEEVETFVESLVRGSIISIHLGNATGGFEEANSDLVGRVSLDPTPSILDGEEKVSSVDMHITEILTWLIDSLKLNHYNIVTPIELQDAKVDLVGSEIALPTNYSVRLNVSSYSLPKTDVPLGVTVTRTAQTGDFYETVFVGDSIMANLMSYVNWRRERDELFWDGATFLVSSKLTLEKALISDEGAPVLPMVEERRIHIDDALKILNARRVYICLRPENIKAYSEERYLTNLKILVYQIRQKNPNIDVVILSIPPVISARNATPSNWQVFNYNLMVCRMCASHGITFLDIAYPLRNDKGALRDEYCLDPDSYGSHLNDAGCEALLNYINANIP
ncbi:MAG: polysaccharide deacetylase family protein [Clostridia bacterium]|nr:polysaccharide deacetylase family protein [Clostridia bacterium]